MKTFTTEQIDAIITQCAREIIEAAEDQGSRELAEAHCYHLMKLMERFE